jgi:peptidoglycan-N-acetylglucosamine deacetylase
VPALRLVRRLGWSPFLWSRWGRDWERSATPASIAARATRDLGGGDIVLLHDADHYSSTGSWLRTAAALPDVLEAAFQTGEPLVALSQSR